MMSLWDALRMNMMISYQELVRTFPNEPMIYQGFQALPRFGNSYTLIGSWVIDDEPAGIGIREDGSLITKDTSRFIPHYIAG